MENKDPFFDFLDGTAGHYEVKPPEETRRKHLADMEAEAIKLKRKRQRNRSLAGLGILLLLLSTVVFLLPFNDPHPSSTNGSSPSVPLVEDTRDYPQGQSSSSSTIQSQPETGSKAAPEPVLPVTASYPDKLKNQDDLRVPASTTHQPEAPVNTQYLPESLLSMTGISSLFIEERSLLLQKLKKRELPMPVKAKGTDTLSPSPVVKRHKKFLLQGITAGIHYTPEYMFNTLDQTDKLVHNAGLEITWHKKPFSIRTGVSLSVATGVTELEYSYNENLGLKQKLDSVSFSFDPEGRKIVPTWYFSEQTVYDTSINITVNSIRKRYTYLQFPLILGYDFLETSRISLGLRAGPVLQVLIDTKQLDTDPSAGNNRVISINQLTPDRLATHWQALFGMNASFILTRRLSLEIEPHVKYYFNSVYEKAATTQKPWSVEWRTAVIIKF